MFEVSTKGRSARGRLKVAGTGACLAAAIAVVLAVGASIAPRYLALAPDKALAQQGDMLFESADHDIKDGTGPAVVRGVAYLFAGDDPWMPPGVNSKVVALDASDGDFLWERELEWAGGMGSKARPLVRGVRLYIGCGEKVYCLDTSRDGASVWEKRITPAEAPLGQSVIITDPVIYSSASGTDVVVVGDYVYGAYLGLSAENGEILWTYALDANCSAIGAPGVDDERNRLYIPQHTSFGHPVNGKLHCLDVSGSTPVKKWEYATTYDVAGGIACHQGMLYFSDFAYGGPISRLYCLEDGGEAARLAWSEEVWGSSGTPLVDANSETLYVCGNEYSVGKNHFYAFELTTGNLKWDNPNWGAYNGNCALSPATGYLYAGSFDTSSWAHNKGLAAMDPYTGSELWCVTSKGGGDPVVVDGVVYSTADGRLYAYREYRPATFDWYFAEGYTGEGYETWLTLANPGSEPEDDAKATVTYVFNGDRDPLVMPCDIPAGCRQTIYVNDVVGRGMEVSVKVVSDRPLVAERPVYFNSVGRGGLRFVGGHCSLGADTPSLDWYFAEGYTGHGFQEWLTLANFEDADAEAEVAYFFSGEEPRTATYSVPARRRVTLDVNRECGRSGDVSVRVRSLDRPLVAERPVYFDFVGPVGSRISGGHCVVGSIEAANKWYFAEGYTGEGFKEWLTLANTSERNATVEVSYLYQDAGQPPLRKKYVVEARKRLTIDVNQEAGPGEELGLSVSSDVPIHAERPLYFRYRYGWSDGNCAVGAPMASNFWCLAEGYTEARFDQYICVSNPGKADAWVVCAPLFGGGETISFSVEAGKRKTIALRSARPTERAYALYADRGVVVERVMYFNYRGSIDGGHCELGATLKDIY